MSPGERRERIMLAATRVFAEVGYRGATTRRIAAEAGVHEVTLFRHFGSKEDLIREAIAWGAEPDDQPHLPDSPVDPAAELIEFSRKQLAHLYGIRSLIRTCMGEAEERPEILDRAMERPVRVHRELLSYLERLRAQRLTSADADLDSAASMLMGSLFAYAMGRDYMPEAYPCSVDEAPARYVKLVLEAIGTSGRNRRRKRGKPS